MTKKVPDRNQAVLYGFAFMQAYQAARGAPQEAAYNMARAAHELNLLHVAVPLYEQALRWVLCTLASSSARATRFDSALRWHAQ